MDLVGLVAGSGWASGVNLYAVVALLGLIGRYTETSAVPDELTGTAVIAVAVGAYLVEFVVDKVPFLDSGWDVLHTAIRPIGAAVLGYLLVGDVSGLEHVGAAGASGALALLSHTAKATTRAAINTSPEPASNFVVSLAEDGVVAVMVWFAVEHPLIALGAVVLLVIAGTALTIALFGAAKRGLARIRARRGARAPG